MTQVNLREALQRYFGHDVFRDGQEEAIRSVLDGHDVVLVMPTGSGKSICYQLSAMLFPGVTIVISPLIALMKDQVDGLSRIGIPATFLNSSVSSGEMTARLDDLTRGKYKLVYVAPERFRNRRFVETLSSLNVSLFTVDEAHCISQWGHDFRPDYLYLRTVLARMGNAVRVMAVTATATPEVCQDIVKQLGLGVDPRGAPTISVTGFARPNLYLSVTPCASHDIKQRHLERVIDAYRCGIVYCATRKMVERVTERLLLAHYKPIMYHGAMNDEERTAAQNRFTEEKSPVVVATNAFGMGVDRSDLRFIVHWDIPGSLEAYYQEIGRAGRDGGFAWCELLFNYVDTRTQQFFIDSVNPERADVMKLWSVVKTRCAEETVTETADDWAVAAGLKNGMLSRTILGMLERAGLISREMVPGKRVTSTALHPFTDANVKELERICNGMQTKRDSDQHKLDEMVHYAYCRICRHKFLLNYFGEKPATARACTICDRCHPRTPVQPVEPTETQWTAIQQALSCVARMHGKFDMATVARVLHGDTSELLSTHALDKLSTYGLQRGKTLLSIHNLLESLLNESCLRLSQDRRQLVILTRKGCDVMLRRYENFRFTLSGPAV